MWCYFRICVENLILVEPRVIAGAEGDYLSFEALTHAPIDRALVDTDIMNRDELSQCDDYHVLALGIVGAQLLGDVKARLLAACAPRGRG